MAETRGTPNSGIYSRRSARAKSKRRRWDSISAFGARGFEGGGHIDGILEGTLEVTNYLASLLDAFINQYVDVIDQFDAQRQLSRCVLSGGIARNLPNLCDLLAQRTGYELSPATALDESLLGLRTIALVADRRAETCRDAQAVFGRDCHIAA